MAAGGSEQRRCGLDGCLKPCEGVVKDVLEKQPAGFGHEAGAPYGYPEGLQTSPSVHDRQHRLPVAPVSGLSVGPSGVHAQSAGQHQGALLPSSLLQKPLDGVSYPQLQPLLALLSAAQQSKPGLLMRSSSCEVPTGSSRKLPHKRTPNVLYKTELCRTWSATGQCRYGSKCQFAHGFHDLRPVQRHPKYKTEVCRTFAATGSCTYGARCKFIHSQASDTDSDETEQQIIAPSKAHSVPANFGSPSSVTHAALLSALRSLLITSQGGSTPAPFNSTSRAPMYQNGSLLASMSDSGDSTPSNLLHTSQLGHQGYINGSKPFDAQYADDTDQSRLTQAAAVLKLLQRQTPALSPFSQALGRLGPVVPAESGSTSGAMNLLSPAPYRNFQNGGDVATPNQQDLWLLSAPSPNDVGKMPALAAENHHGGTQAFWS